MMYKNYLANQITFKKKSPGTEFIVEMFNLQSQLLIVVNTQNPFNKEGSVTGRKTPVFTISTEKKHLLRQSNLKWSYLQIISNQCKYFLFLSIIPIQTCS